MKAWEETWEADEDRVRNPKERVTIAFGPMDEDVARLAAAAPEMARLLIEVYNRVNDPLADRVVDVLEKAGVLTVARAKMTL